MSVETVRQALEGSGLELSAALSREAYDRIVPAPWQADRVHPGCLAVLIVGNAGRTLWPRFRASPEASQGDHPLDRYTRRVLESAACRAEPRASVVLYNERRESGFPPLIGLAARAGLGSPGRIGLLLHPVYGPWISLRGLLFLSESVPCSEPAPFDPCRDCPAPCESACPAGAVGAAGLDLASCLRVRQVRRECRVGCDSRSACVLGREHSFSREQIEYHSRLSWPWRAREGPGPRPG